MKNYPLLLLLAFAAFSGGCKSNRFFATPPDYKPENEAYVRQPSMINLPISIPMKAINEELNRQFSGLIYEDADYENNNTDNLQVRIWRTKKDIRVDGYKEKVRIVLPLEIWAAYRWEACDLCPSIEKSTAFEMNLTLNTLLRVGSDWKILTTTTATDITFSKEPVLNFGPVDIPITRLVKNALTSNLPAITAGIDEQVTESVPVKEYLSEAWLQIQEPILVDSAYKAWLVMVPQNVFISPLQTDAQKIMLNTGITAFVETKLGAKPRINSFSKLSAPVIQEKIENKFSLEVPIAIDFEMATEMARKHLKDSTFAVAKKKSVTVRDIVLYGKGGDVFIKADLSGSFDGIIYFRGKPAIDTVTNKIYFADLDFDINTKNSIYKIAAWMAHGTLKKVLQKEFTYNITDDLRGASETIRGYLKGYSYEDLLTVKGRAADLRLKKIYCDEEVIRAIFTMNGNASLQVNTLSLTGQKKP